MADIPYSGNAPVRGADARANAVQTLGTVTNWAGAALSLGLIVGIGVWGYKTLSRDVSGVPVVRAASGDPMRIQPEDPGGSPALNQGLAVNQVAARGAAEKPADRLILAPAPVSLSSEDLPSGDVTLSPAAAPAANAPARPQAPAAGETPQMASIRALADKLSTGSDPLGQVVAAPQAAAEATPPETLQAAAVQVPEAPAKPVVQAETPKKAVIKGGLKRSLRPVLRPGNLQKTAAVAAPTAATGATEIDPAQIPVGTRLAQLGAFDSPATARQEWDKLNDRFGDYLEGKQRVIQRAKSGGRVFYRLRAMGFADMSDARRFCSALVAERADCIPLTTR